MLPLALSWLLVLLAWLLAAVTAVDSPSRQSTKRAYNASTDDSGRCGDRRWQAWRLYLWQVALGYRDLPIPADPWRPVRFFHLCPEGVASFCLAHYVRSPDLKQEAVRQLARWVPHFNAAGLERNLQRGGWPDFGVARQVLGAEVHRQRFPAVADLVMDAEPHFAASGMAPAPQRVVPWDLEPQQHDAELISSGSTVDGGMRRLLESSVLTGWGPELLLLDVGAFDGSSLLASALRARMNHSVLAFEPSPRNQRSVELYLLAEGLLDKVFAVDPADAAGWPGGQCWNYTASGSRVASLCGCTGSPGCATLLLAGLAAADYEAELPEQGAYSGLAFQTFGLASVDAVPTSHKVKLLKGLPVVQWWVHQVLQRDCIDIHLLKIDTEGSEFSVLRGLEPLFAQHRVHFVFMEFWPLGLMAGGVDPVGMLRWLAHYGFLCRGLGHTSPNTFEEIVANLTPDWTISNYQVHGQSNSLDDLLCEDTHWQEPCGKHGQRQTAK